jgi:hypothetical protein
MLGILQGTGSIWDTCEGEFDCRAVLHHALAIALSMNELIARLTAHCVFLTHLHSLACHSFHVSSFFHAECGDTKTLKSIPYSKLPRAAVITCAWHSIRKANNRHVFPLRSK